MDQVDYAIGKLKPDSMKGYTIGDNTNRTCQAPVAPRREARLSRLREIPQGGSEERVHPQRPVPAVGRETVSASAPILRRSRRRQGGEGLAAAQLHHLPRRLSLPRRRHGRGRLEAVRGHRARRVGERPRRYPGEVRREERLRRRRPAVRAEHRRRAAPVGGDDGPLIRPGLRAVCWGTDAIWTAPLVADRGIAAPEIPEDLKSHGFAALGPTDGPVKTAVFGGNNAPVQLRPQPRQDRNDKLAE